MTPPYPMNSRVRRAQSDLAAADAPDAPTIYRNGVPVSGTGAQPNAPPPSPVSFPPRLYPPPGSTAFYAQGNASIGPGPATWTVPASIVVVIPANALAVIRAFNLYINNMLSTTAVQFQIRVNGSAVPGFDNLTLFPRAAASVGEAFGGAGEIAIDVGTGSTIDVNIRITDAGTYVVGASFYGWYYSAQLAQTYARTGGY